MWVFLAEPLDRLGTEVRTLITTICRNSEKRYLYLLKVYNIHCLVIFDDFPIASGSVLIIGSIRNRREMSWSRKIGMVQSQCFSRKITWLINRHFLICACPLLLQFSVSFSFSFSFSIHSNFYQNQIGRSCSQNVFAYTSRFVTSRFVQLSTKQMTWECKMHSKMQRALFSRVLSHNQWHG